MQFKAIVCATLMSVLVLLPFSASSETFDVSDMTEFQNALDVAGTNGDSDTISVSGGTYDVTATLRYWASENFTLTVRGMGDGSTVLDGGNLVQIAEFISADLSGHLTVDDLVFRNGNSMYGGALYMETDAALIMITHCEFYDNSSTDVGGAVNAYSTAGDISVSNCLFEGNESGRAGGLFAQTESGFSTSLTSCVFEDNSCTVDGGGTMLYPLGAGASLVVENNTFTSNQAGNFGGGCWSRMPAGSSTVVYTGNVFTNNTTLTGDGAGTYIEIQSGTLSYGENSYESNTSGLDGGGAWIWHGTGSMDLSSNTFTRNHAVNNGGGASVITDEGMMTIGWNVFDSNSSDNVGGGLDLATTTGTLSVRNNTFYGNSASEGGGIYFYFDQSGAQADVVNTILWQDAPQEMAYSGAQTVTVTYSDVENGEGEPWFGPGCINADPLFADPTSGDFSLTWTSFPIPDVTKSPCIDAGDPASAQDPDGTIADMGAHFFAQGAGNPGNRPTTIRVISFDKAVPNPFSRSTVLRYSLPASSYVGMRVYDSGGRLVKILLGEQMSAGDHAVVWNARDLTRGIYFCLLDVEGSVMTRKVILVDRR
jgi:hypothetical protein